MSGVHASSLIATCAHQCKSQDPFQKSFWNAAFGVKLPTCMSSHHNASESFRVSLLHRVLRPVAHRSLRAILPIYLGNSKELTMHLSRIAAKASETMQANVKWYL